MSDTSIPPVRHVSIHGGHSGEFCMHAEDRLEAIVKAYIARGYDWVGITEHMPPPTAAMCFPEERAAGLSPEDLARRFDTYMTTCRALQNTYRHAIRIFVGFETETYTGATDQVRHLVGRHRPDYFVGSIHHVADRGFDMSPDAYAAIAADLGGMDVLYCRYFDEQLAMIEVLRPPVVGHFDLIRIFDPDYHRRLTRPAIALRVRRNLERIAELGMILDFNTAALSKGAREPYLSRPILEMARDLGISVVPGDDSHGVATVGRHFDEAVKILAGLGMSLDWPEPALPAIYR